jgi:hypothetical protein
MRAGPSVDRDLVGAVLAVETSSGLVSTWMLTGVTTALANLFFPS